MSEDIWAEFDDWLEDGGPGGGWPSIFESKELTEEQKQVVERNAKLLLDREAWNQRIKAFVAALDEIADDFERNKKRSDYAIRFDGYEFDRELYPELLFTSYKFPCSVSFVSVKFGDGDVFFNRSEFYDGDISFRGAQFGEGNVSFVFSHFDADYVTFREVRLSKSKIDFYYSTFDSRYVEFSEMELSRRAKFSAMSMTVKGQLILASDFPGSVMFTDLKVSESTYLFNSLFQNCPDFRFAVFGRPPEVNGMEIPSPKMKGEKLFYIFKTSSDVDDAPKYRKLKAMALAANDHEKDGEFFAYEMMAKRGVEITGFWELLANSFYYHVSYYGQSWTRPLVGVFISWFVFTFIYLNSVAMILKAGSLNFSAIYSALNSFPFLSSLHRLTLKPQDYEGSLEKTLDTLAKHDGVVDTILNWAMFQQFIGIVLLFFLLLGLRNRFRLK